MKYQKILNNPIFEAEQFLPPNQIPNGVFNVYEWHDGIFTGQILTPSGIRKDVRATDWVITTDFKDRFDSIPNNVFMEKYEEVNQ